MSESPKTVTTPYLAYETFKSAIRGLGDAGHLPDRIDNSVFPSLSGSGRSQLMQALKYFRLIDDKGVPSKLLGEISVSDESGWKTILKPLLIEFYPAQIKPLETGTVATFKDSFGSIGTIAVPAARFLLAAARDVGLKVSGHISKVPGGPQKKKKEETEVVAPDTKVPPPVTPSKEGRLEFIKEMMPKYDPTWDKETTANWMAAMKGLLDTVKGGEA